MQSASGSAALTPRIAPSLDIALIISEWEALSREEPWHLHPDRYGVDSLHEAIAAIVDVASEGSSVLTTAGRLVRAAAAHGEQRRAQGVEDDSLFREYHALRATLWRHLRRSGDRTPRDIASMLRMDVAIGVATTISLRGYHRSELAPETIWEADLLSQIDAVSRHLGDLLYEHRKG